MELFVLYNFGIPLAVCGFPSLQGSGCSDCVSMLTRGILTEDNELHDILMQIYHREL